MKKKRKKYINIKDAGLWDPKAHTRDADVIIKNSVLTGLRKQIQIARKALADIAESDDHGSWKTACEAGPEPVEKDEK